MLPAFGNRLCCLHGSWSKCLFQQEHESIFEPRTAWDVCRQRANDLFTDLQHELTESQLLQLGPGQEFRQFSAVVIMQGSMILQTYATPGGQLPFGRACRAAPHDSWGISAKLLSAFMCVAAFGISRPTVEPKLHVHAWTCL